VNRLCGHGYLPISYRSRVFTLRSHSASCSLLAPCCVLLAACAGGGAGLDSNGRPAGSGGSGGALTATFQSIQDNVFTPICSVCHAGGAAPQGLRLDPVNSYLLLVGVPSTEVSSIVRVRPGDPDNSYLVQKIEGHAAVGAQMPFGAPPLPASTIAVIRQWITDGAPHGVAVSATRSQTFSVVSVAPAAGDVLVERPMRIAVGFGRELDITRLDGSSVRLDRLTIELGEAAAVEVPVDVAVPVGNPFALMVTPRQPLVDGRYRLLVRGPPDAGVSDIGGERLHAAARGGELTQFTVETGR
jgi:hypothetical protein